jgi:hypothetical protein
VLARGYSWLSNAPLLVVFVVLAFFTGWGLFRHLRGARSAADGASRVGCEPGLASRRT